MKHKLFFTLFCFIPSIMMAQSGYTIQGRITNLKQTAKVYLAMTVDGRWQDIDSAEVKKGKFRLKGSVSHPQPVILSLRRLSDGPKQERDQRSFFLENSKIRVEGTGSIKNATVSGSVSDRQQTELSAKTAPLTKSIIRIQNEFADKPKEELYVDGKLREEVARAGDTVRRLVQEIKDINRNFVENHLDSYYGLYVYSNNVLASKFEPQQVEPLFHRFTEELKTSELGKKTWERIQAAKRMDIGARAVDFTQDDLDGNPFTLSSLRGKYVLVDFWASWCIPCRKENPHLVKAYEALKDKNFEIVGVSLDQSKPAWENAVKADNLPWIHVSDLKGWKNDVSLLFGISSVPQNFLIDPNGVIIGKNLRGDDLTEQLTSLIK